jgi:hypothetical protein
MKKLFVLLIGMFLSVAVMAQTTGTTYTLTAGQTYYSTPWNYNATPPHTGTYSAAAKKDSIGGTATLTWTFALNKTQLYYYQFFIGYDTIRTVARTVGNTVITWLEGSVDNSNWVALDSTIFKPTANWLTPIQTTVAARCLEGTMNLRDVTTGQLWKYLRIRAVGQTANECALITHIDLKLGLRY